MTFVIIDWPRCFAPLAQLDRASGYEPEGREFESLRARHLFTDAVRVSSIPPFSSPPLKIALCPILCPISREMAASAASSEGGTYRADIAIERCPAMRASVQASQHGVPTRQKRSYRCELARSRRREEYRRLTRRRLRRPCPELPFQTLTASPLYSTTRNAWEICAVLGLSPGFGLGPPFLQR